MKWISILDMLPANGQEVIFCELAANSQYVHHGYYEDGGWYVSFLGKVSKVTHWIPVTSIPDIEDSWDIIAELRQG